MRSLSSLVLAVFAAGFVAPAGAQPPDPSDDCQLLQNPVVDLPLTAEGDTCMLTDDVSSYGGMCAIQGFEYRGGDAIYEIVLNEGNRVGFRLEPLQTTSDFVLALLNACGDGTSCVANSPDFIGPDVEEIAAIEREPGVYYLYVDSPDPSHCGGYRLFITGENPRPMADLDVGLTSSANPAFAGSRLTYTLTVTNHGPQNAYGVSVTQTLPAGVELVRVPEGCRMGAPGQADLPRSLTCTIERLSANGRAEFEVPVRVLETTRRTIVTRAMENGFTVNDSHLPNEASLEIPVFADVDLTLTKSSSANPVIAGTGLTYTLRVRNDSNRFDGTEITVTDELPRETSLLGRPPQGCKKGPKGTVVCELEKLAPGESAEFALDVRVDSSASGSFRNKARVRSIDNDRKPTDNVTTLVRRRVNLGLDLDGPSEAVTAGSGEGNLTHVLTVTNGGPSDASGVKLTTVFTLPQGVTIVRGPSPSRGRFANGVWNLGDLPAGSTETLTVRFTVGPSAPAARDVIQTRAEVTALSEPNSGEVEETLSTSISRRVTLVLDPEGPSDPIVASTQDDNLTHVLTVRNEGPSDASGLEITAAFTLPHDVAPPEVTLSRGSFTDGVWRLGDLPAKTAETLTAVFSVGPSAPADAVVTEATVTALAEDNSGETSDSVSTSIRRDVNFEIGLVVSPEPAIAGDSLDYKLEIRNSGPSNALETVTVTDVLPRPTSLETLPHPQACREDSPGTVVCKIGQLLVDQTVTGTLTVKVDAATRDLLVNRVTVSSPEATEDAERIERTEVKGVARLRVQQSDSPDPATAGETRLGYEITVTNGGPSDVVKTVQLTDDLPAKTSLEELPNSNACQQDPSGKEVTCTFNYLPAGKSLTGTLTVLVAPDALETLENKVEVAYEEDPGSPRQRVERTEVSTIADLAIDKSASADVVVAGGHLDYTITVVNRGPSYARDVVVEDLLPWEATSPEVDGCVDVLEPLRCKLETLEVLSGDEGAGRRQLTVGVDVAEVDTSRTVPNMANVSSSTTEGKPGDEGAMADTRVTVPDTADLVVDQEDDPDPVVAGGEVVYTVTVVNNGPLDGDGVTVQGALTDSAEEEASVEVGDTMGCEEDPGGFPECTLGTIAAGEEKSYTLVVQVDPQPGGRLFHRATVESATPPGNTEDLVSVEDTRVTLPGTADLLVGATAAPDPVRIGDLLTYTFKVTNFGPEAAENAKIDVELAEGVEPVPDQAGDCAPTEEPRTLRCQLGTLAGESAKELALEVRVLPDAESPLVSSATVSSDTPEGNPGEEGPVPVETALTGGDLLRR